MFEYWYYYFSNLKSQCLFSLSQGYHRWRCWTATKDIFAKIAFQWYSWGSTRGRKWWIWLWWWWLWGMRWYVILRKAQHVWFWKTRSKVSWTLYILASTRIFSILFSRNFLRCCQGEFVKQLRASLVVNNFHYSCDLNMWLKGDTVIIMRHYMLVTLKSQRVKLGTTKLIIIMMLHRLLCNI